MHQLIGTDVVINFSELYMALVQVFVIILLGYACGRAGIISSSEGRGLARFVSHCALPALVLNAMIQLEFDVVSWKFLAAILISKSIVFAVVLLFTLILQAKPLHLGHAGLYAIFSTQSNDFALGYPIIKALYSASNPEYLQYIYLIAPISLCILNPIGFVLLEIQKQKDVAGTVNKCQTVVSVVKSMLTNPIIMMTLLGIIGNFIFKHDPPHILVNTLEPLSNAFTACALFYLGHTMVGKVQSQLGYQLLTPGLLIVAKTLMLPFITREIVLSIAPGNNSNETIDYSNYGFLYGMFPVAPTVFVFASHYNTAIDLIATGMVVCTLISAPLMFVSAKSIAMLTVSESTYKLTLTRTMLHIAITSLVLSVWTLAVFVLTRKVRRALHAVTTALVMSQMLSCLGVILWNTVDVTHDSPSYYLQFIVYYTGVLSTRTITAVLAVAMCALQCRSLCYLLRCRCYLILAGFGIPLVLTGITLTTSNGGNDHASDPEFQYGRPQLIVSSIVLITCLLTSVSTLVIQNKWGRHDLLTHATRRSGRLNSVTDCEQPLLAEQQTSDSATSTTDSSANSVPDHSRVAGESIPIVHNSNTSRFYKYANKARPESASLGAVSKSAGSFSTSAPTRRRAGSSSGSNRPSVDIEDLASLPEASALLRASPVVGCHDKDGCCKSSVSQKQETLMEYGRNGDGKMAPCAGSSEDYDEDDSYDINGADSVTSKQCSSKETCCSQEQRRKCAVIIKKYDTVQRAQMIDGERMSGDCDGPRLYYGTAGGGGPSNGGDEHQITRHVLIVLLNTLSIIIGIFLCMWRIFSETASGVYIELEFLDAIFNFGQAFFVFAIFGFDAQWFVAPLMRRWRRCFYGSEAVHLPDVSSLDSEVTQTCDQFVRYHMRQCEAALCRHRVYKYRTVPHSLLGTALVDWLLDVGLVTDRAAGVRYGRALLDGRVIRHWNDMQHFSDMPYFYVFIQDNIMGQQQQD